MTTNLKFTTIIYYTGVTAGNYCKYNGRTTERETHTHTQHCPFLYRETFHQDTPKIRTACAVPNIRIVYILVPEMRTTLY